jgi:superfamily II DNA or RNA helicase
MSVINIPNPATLVIQGGMEVSEWRKTLEIRSPGYQFTDAFRKGYWDGYIRPGKLTVNGPYHKLLIGRGMLNSYRQFLEENDHPKPKYRLGYSPIDKPSLFNIPPAVWDTLRDYQQEALESSVENRWGKVALATNAGKGAVIALLASILVPHKTLILADEVSVFQALEEELGKWTKEPIGLIEGGQKKIPKENIVLGMAPTISRRVTSKNTKEKEKWVTWLKGFKALLLDEADRATSKTWTNILWEAKNTEFRIGFSGSFPPFSTVDGIKLEENIGPELILVRNKELVERGISARPSIVLHNYEYDHNEDLSEADLHEVYNQLVVNNDDRNRFICSLLDDGPNAVVCHYIEHGEILRDMIPDSVFLRGEDSKDKRLEVLEAFQAGEFSTLITTKILDRGSNLLGHTSCLVFASGRGSNRQILQRIGRGLRRGGGKEEIILKDIYDMTHEYLVNAAEKRLDVYKDEGFDVEIIPNE